ncbi:MAG: ribosome silencing factor [Acidobacteria bacterium]|nr:ribosome silencing factor [Acidobacteriota bacterium]
MPESRERTEEGRTPEAKEVAQPSAEEGLDERLRLALHAASEKKAHDLVVLDLREVASFTDYFVIASGTNVRQVQAVADAVQEQLRKQLGVKPARVEGYNTAEWVLLDYGDFIFHVFEEKSRRFYDLERLWRDAARVPVPSDVTGEGARSSRDEG